MERDEVEAAIRSAFAGVRLGPGVSLQQARFIDVYLDGITEEEFEALPEHETTDDWTAIPESALVCDSIAHLDADGLRYYLPALMLWLLDHYNDRDTSPNSEVEMTVIGTISSLAFVPDFEEYRRPMYDTLNPDQRAAIASYLEALPDMVALRDEDRLGVARSLDRYWAQFIREAPQRIDTAHN